MPNDKPKTSPAPMPAFVQETRVTTSAAVEELSPDMLGKLGPSDPLPESMRAFLEIVEGPGAHGLFQMAKPILLLGRAEGIVDVFVDDEAASRYHVAVAHRAGKFHLVDMGSTNGTLVNNVRVRDAELKSGDRIKIGETVILFGVIGGA